MDTETIHDQVRKRFASVATDPASEKRFEIGRASAVRLGYDTAILKDLPIAAVESFAGVGNPLAPPRPVIHTRETCFPGPCGTAPRSSATRVQPATATRASAVGTAVVAAESLPRHTSLFFRGPLLRSWTHLVRDVCTLQSQPSGSAIPSRTYPTRILWGLDSRRCCSLRRSPDRRRDHR